MFRLLIFIARQKNVPTAHPAPFRRSFRHLYQTIFLFLWCQRHLSAAVSGIYTKPYSCFCGASGTFLPQFPAMSTTEKFQLIYLTYIQDIPQRFDNQNMPASKEHILILDHRILYAVNPGRIEWVRDNGPGIHISPWLRDMQVLPPGTDSVDIKNLRPSVKQAVCIKFKGVEETLKAEFLLGRYKDDVDKNPLGPVLILDALLDQLDSGAQNRQKNRISLVKAMVESQIRRQDKEIRKETASAERARTWRRTQNRLDTVTQSTPFRIGLFLTILITISMFGIMLFEPGNNPGFESLWDSFWYSIVTVTTVGYGDKSPITVGGKLVGLLLMGIGVIVLAAITGQIASFFVELQMRRREGLVNLKNIKNHFIICGWRKELDKVLDGLLSVNPEFDVSDLVLVNHVEKEKLQPIFDNPRYNRIKYISGDYVQAETLQRASIESASRLMVLADSSSNYSQQQVDSRTVMTVLTIESLNRHVYVVAELLDPKFEKFLKLANCDEIILSSEYSTLIIANASNASGVSHVIRDLLTTDNGQGLRSREIPDEFCGKSFGDLFDYLNQQFGDITIGILENTGNFYQRKREALSEAQMTPDISRLVENLKSVKQLIPNNSILNPGQNYIIKSHSRAIVIEARFREAIENPNQQNRTPA